MSLDTTRLRALALSDTGFVFDPSTGYTFTASATALSVIRALKDGRSVDEAVADLAEHFELDGADDPGRDVAELVVRLREQGLVP